MARMIDHQGQQVTVPATYRVVGRVMLERRQSAARCAAAVVRQPIAMIRRLDPCSATHGVLLLQVDGKMQQRGDPAYVRKAIEGSLERLEVSRDSVSCKSLGQPLDLDEQELMQTVVPVLYCFSAGQQLKSLRLAG